MEQSEKTPRIAWLIVVLLVPVGLLNYLDRQMLAAMKFSVMHDIPSIGVPGQGGEANWGKVLALFKWVYAVFSPIAGYIADRYSRRYVIAGSLFVWSGVTWATAHVTTYEQLLATRALMGLSEAFYFPAALALIADWHSVSTRSRAVGCHQMGIYVGVIVGGFAGYVADNPNLGWRWGFDACGIIGVIYAIPLFLYLRDARRPAEPVRPKSLSPGEAMGALSSNPSFILLVLYFTLPALAGWIMRDWMPAVLKTEFGLGQGKAGFSATFYLQVAAIVGAVLGGWLSDRWMRRSVRGRIYVSAIGVSLIVPSLFGVGYAPQTKLLWMAIAFLILFGIGWGFFDSNNMPILCQITRPELRATGYGIMNLVSISCGGLADWSFGAMRDARVPLFEIFSIFASAAVISVVLVLLIQPRHAE